jgi:hypothetical protein
MMFNSPVYPSLAWCVLGYFFLGRCQPAGAILAAMAAITVAWYAREGGSSSGR